MTKAPVKTVKKRPPRVAILCIVLAACLLLCGGVLLYLFGGTWYYPLFRSMIPAKEIPLTETAPDSSWQTVTLDDLFSDPRTERNDCLMLINNAHPIPEGFIPLLEEYNGAKMNPAMVSPYCALRDSVQQKTGTRIYVSADFRTPEEQTAIFEESDDGIAAKVGCSEHEAGLALDLYAPKRAGEQFLNSRAGRKVNTDAADHGFIIRYPKGKEDITGISYEPWHVRYVGAPHARYMTDAGLTLEEYLDFLTPDTVFSGVGIVILRTAAQSVTVPAGFTRCTASPDNTGYAVFTFFY